MLNPLSFLSKIIKSSNQRELDKISKIVVKINSLEETVKGLKDEDFPRKTEQFKERIKNGEEKLVGFMVGQIIKSSGGSINPGIAKEILSKELNL